jgi:serine/threonine-protein kinase
MSNPTADFDSMWDQIDALCARFEAAWIAGECPRIEDYLEQVPEAKQSGLFDELLATELELRRKAGEQPAEDEYRRRFPAREIQITAASSFSLSG